MKKSVSRIALSIGAAAMLVACGAWAQNKTDQNSPSQSAPQNEPAAPAPSPYQSSPSPSTPNVPAAASSSATVSGTVESITEGKVMKVKTAEGKTKTYRLKDASVDPSIKVGSAVRVTQSRDVDGKSSLTVEPDSGKN